MWPQRNSVECYCFVPRIGQTVSITRQVTEQNQLAAAAAEFNANIIASSILVTSLGTHSLDICDGSKRVNAGHAPTDAPQPESINHITH